MNPDPTPLWAIELPTEWSRVETLAPLTSGGATFLGVAVSVHDDIDAGDYRIALTQGEARKLHDALGAALAESSTEP